MPHWIATLLQDPARRAARRAFARAERELRRRSGALSAEAARALRDRLMTEAVHSLASGPRPVPVPVRKVR